MKYLFSAVVASALMTGAAFADNVGATPNWTGFYAGGQLGYANVELSVGGVSSDESGVIGGLVAGYDYDLGAFVVGAGFDYDWSDIGDSSAGVSLDLDSIWRAKLRGGYKIGNGLLYATAGYAEATVSASVAGLSVDADDDGYFAGAGYDHMVAPNMSLGGELLYHEFDNFLSSGVDADTFTAQIRATYRF
ncbi:outer membrane protein [Roseovarius sp. S1116L3]|uniref:outer membrane protein n=1 Tax=Roseovarius roseus TaxID=3342636 RepID=UPI00372C2F1E